MPVGAQRHMHDPRAQPRRCHPAEAERVQRALSDSPARKYLHRPSSPDATPRAPLRPADRAAPIVSRVRCRSPTAADSYRCGPVISSTSAPCAASVRPHTGPAMTRVRSSTRTPPNGRAAGGSACGGASPMRVIATRGSGLHRAGPADAGPLFEASHRGDAQAGARRAILDLERAVPGPAPPPLRPGHMRNRAAAARRRGDAESWCATATSAPSPHL